MEPVEMPSPGTGEPAGEGQQDQAIPTEVRDLLRSKPELLSEVLADLPDEYMQKVPHVEKRVAKFVEHKSKELADTAKKQREADQAQHQELIRAQQFVSQVEAMSSDQWGNLTRQNPEYAAQYAQAKKLAASGSSTELEVANRIWSKARKELEDKFGADLSQVNSLEEAVEKVSEGLSSKQAKELESAFDKKLEAFKAEFSGKLLRQGDQPEKGSSNGSAPSGKRTYTREEIARMPLKQYRELAEDLDLAAREGRIK